jgi:isopenicillin N synthase-like dioxygenase
VDFSKFLHGNEEEQKQCIAEIMKGFTTSGFLYLNNTGLSPAEAYKWSEKYFALPVEVKQQHPNTNMEANRGYSGMGVERVTNADLTGDEDIAELRAMIPDLKESLEIGSDAGRYPEKPWKNLYPEEHLPGFGAAMRKFYEQCDELHHQLLSAIAEGLELPRDYFKEYVTASDHCLRLLHYPSVPKAVLEKPGAVRAGAHTDYGTVTLLFQDGSGGLQVQTPDGSYVDVPPVEDAIVINAGTSALRALGDSKAELTMNMIQATCSRSGPTM